MSKIYTFTQLTQHTSSEDCWLLIGGKVYDVTKFLEEHPGGDDVLLSATGKDATDDFEDVGHSQTARGMLKNYYIGDMDVGTVPKSKTYVPPKQPAYNHDKSAQFCGKVLQFILPFTVFGIAVAVHFYTKSSA